MERGEMFGQSMPGELKSRTGYLEGRADLFETKLLQLEHEHPGRAEDIRKLLVISRDPGSANALLPVMELLDREKNLDMSVLTDGRAQEIIQKKFQTKDITPQGLVLEAANTIGTPDVVLTDASTSEQGIESFAAGTFPDVPMVLVEDYYTSSLKYLHDLKERQFPLPVKICVMDEEAKNIVLEKFPELEDRIEVTGQPAFDRFAKEDTEGMSQEVREKLGVAPGEKIISYMSQMERPDMIHELARELGKNGHNFYLAFRRHPRDNVSYEEYEEIFKGAGIKTIDTRQFSTDQVSAASDTVITGYSTEGLHGIYRRKPTIHIIDKELQDIPEDLSLPLPPVKLGASMGIDKVGDLSGTLNELLDPASPANKELLIRMDKFYPRDGKNAQRVAGIVAKVISQPG